MSEIDKEFEIMEESLEILFACCLTVQLVDLGIRIFKKNKEENSGKEEVS